MLVMLIKTVEAGKTVVVTYAEAGKVLVTVKLKSETCGNLHN
jgi:hypothetical protein